jgi:sulfur transfer protein SufE
VCEGCNGLTADQVAQIKYTDFDWLGGNLTLNKKKGLQAMLNHIKNIAKT